MISVRKKDSEDSEASSSDIKKIYNYTLDFEGKVILRNFLLLLFTKKEGKKIEKKNLAVFKFAEK